MGSIKKSWIIIAALVLLVIITISSYNGMVNKDQDVKEGWGNVQSAYQRRADLIPNLVNTVKGSAEFEKSVLTEVTQARAGIVNAKTPQDLEMMGKKINTAINLAYEAYPELKTTAAFQGLQTQIEGTENRINKARNDYNAVVKVYNSKIKGFPTVLMAKMFGFEVKENFAAKEGAENAPTVKF